MPYFPKFFTHYLAISRPKAMGAIRELSPEEYSTFQTHRAVIRTHFDDCKIFLSALINFNEYSLTMDSYNKTCNEHVNMIPTEMGSEVMVLNVNRLILNFLSSARTFLDHIGRRLDHSHGKDSHEFKSFKKDTANAFDHSFSCRFLYKLRNYVQHCGMPIGCMNINTNYADDETDEVIQVLEFRFKRDSLLTDFDGWGKVEDDLKVQPEYFPIRPHVEEFMSWIERFQTSLTASAAPALIESIRVLELLIAEASVEEGVPFIGYQMPDPEDSTRSKIIMESFPIESMGFLKKSIKKTFGVGMTDFFSHTE